jgi:hypothetical protein
MMSICSAAPSNKEIRKISDCSTDISPDLSDPMEVVRTMVAKLKKSTHLHEELFGILDKVSAFVTASKSPGELIRRLLACGCLRVGNVIVLGTKALSDYLKLSRQALNRCLQRMGWVIEKSDIAYDKIHSGVYFPEYPGIFDPPMMSLFQSKSLSFRIPIESSVEATYLHVLYKDRIWTQEVEASMDIRAKIDEVMAEACSPYTSPIETRLKLARMTRGYTLLQKEYAELKKQLEQFQIPEIIVEIDENSIIPQSEELFEAVPMPVEPPTFNLPNEIVNEMNQLLEVAKCRRRYSPDMWKFAFLLQKTSAQTYRLLAVVLPFPAERSVRAHFGSERHAIIEYLQGSGLKNLQDLVAEYRRLWGIDNGQVVPSTLAFDATSVTNTGIQAKKRSENCFAFILLPLDCHLPDLLIHSMPHKTGRIDQSVLQSRDDLIANLPNCGFSPTFIATDGDNGVSNIHKTTCDLYRHCGTNISPEVIVNQFTDNGARHLICWPISDFLHLLKNARTRIATGTLAFDASIEEVISAAGLNQTLQLGTDLLAHNPLDLLKDDLALRVFTLGNLLKLWAKRQLTGVYFLMPFVALNLAIRNDLLSQVTRLQLIQLAFSIFFRMLKNYPETGEGLGIYEVSRDPAVRKTLWTETMCIRSCNLCVGLYWAIQTFPDSLPLGRIGTHSVECHFGTTRSMLRGDTRWDQFLGREVDACLAQRFLKELDLKPYIRRFANASGSTIMAADEHLITVDFGNVPEKVETFATSLKHGVASLMVFQDRSKLILAPFQELARRLCQAGHAEKIDRPSLTGGLCIANRMFAASEPREELIEFTDPTMAQELVFQHADDIVFTS